MCICYIELNKLVSKLDSRIKDSARSGGFKSKQRTLCSPSTLLPPANPPKWAITEEYLQDTKDTTASSMHDPGTSTSLDATPTSRRVTGISTSLDVTPSSGRMPGISAALEVINDSTPQCVSRPVTQRRLNMSAAVVNSSVSITDKSSSTIINPRYLPDKLDVVAEESGSDTDDSNSSSSQSD